MNEWMDVSSLHLSVDFIRRTTLWFFRLLYIRNRMISRYFVCCQCFIDISRASSALVINSSVTMIRRFSSFWVARCDVCWLVWYGVEVRCVFLSLLLALGRLLWTVSRVETPWILNNGNVLHTCIRIGIRRRFVAVFFLVCAFGARVRIKQVAWHEL